MFRPSLIVCTFFLLVSSETLRAEEQVTLKSGTRLVGTVTLNGQTVSVRIGDSQLTIPLSEVDLIAAVGTDAKNSPEQLLMIALEARARQGTSAGQVGLLAEAYRQAPDDARIAYWYAQSLADAGLGNAAQAVLQKHRTAIEATLPGMTQQLGKQIQERIELEHLPARLAARIDQLNKSVGVAPLRSDRVPVFVRFRLTDSTGQPVEKSALRIDCNGNDERLEAFEAGYYLVTFNSYRNNEDPECKLTVSSPGLESKEFDLQPAADHVPNAGNFVIKRYGDTDKVPLKILVVDQAGKSVSKASVTLRPQNRNDENAVQTTATDDDGRALFEAFPMGYTYSVSAKGFKTESGGVELKRDPSGDEPQQVKLYPAISATIRFAWTTLQGGVTTSNETTVELGEGVPPVPYSPDTMHLLRPVQIGDKLTLQASPTFWGGPMAASPPWVRRAPTNLIGDSSAKFFTDVDLQKLDTMKSEWETVEMTGDGVRRGPYPPFSFEVKQGDVFVGQMPGRDLRNGQPSLVSFKAFVEKVSTAGGSE